MNAEARPRDSARFAPPSSVAAPRIAAGSSVVLLRPRKLRGTIGVARRPVTGGWEVEIRSPLGTPLHLTLPVRALRPR